MKAKRQSILSICLVCLVVLGIAAFVLQFAAPNPTHRWYSSEVLDVNTTTTSQRGTQGEDLLAQDLGLEQPTNERSSGAVCVCGQQFTGTVPPQCNQCAVYSADISNFRIPDFVTTSFIAESKNHRTLAASQTRDLEQITEMAAGARALGIPLYIFVRVNTVVDQVYYDLARSTGGDVVQYFLVDGYENRLIAESAINGLLVLVFVLAAGAGIWVYIMNNRPSSPSEESIDEVDKAEDSVQDTEEFMKRMERLSKRSKDEDNKKGKS